MTLPREAMIRRFPLFAALALFTACEELTVEDPAVVN